MTAIFSGGQPRSMNWAAEKRVFETTASMWRRMSASPSVRV